jgi:hypothetical protein
LRRQEEIRPWFHIFALLNVTPLAILQKASVGPVLPEMLNDNPEEYRGKVVTVRGRLVRCRKVPCGPNEIGMRAYYEVWMVPKKNAKQPINICAIEVCRPLRDEAAKGKPVEATGIFFKRRAFAKESKVVQTPVVLAKQLRQIKGIHSEKERRFSAGQAFMIFLLAAILGVGGVLMVRILLRVLGEKLNEPASSENKASDKPPGETELPKEAKPPEQGASDPDLVESR